MMIGTIIMNCLRISALVMASESAINFKSMEIDTAPPLTQIPAKPRQLQYLALTLKEAFKKKIVFDINSVLMIVSMCCRD